MTDSTVDRLDLSVVVVTRSRASLLVKTIEHLIALPEKPPILVVDNASEDGSVQELRRFAPQVQVIALKENLGPAARNLGVSEATTPYVAFCDDDSWWAPFALAQAKDLFERHPRLGLIAARVLVGPHQKEDPTNRVMSQSPLPCPPDAAGPAILGFLACGAVVRRSAYLDVGGFCPQFDIGGEEQLLAIDLAAAGWQLAYVDTVIAYHHPPGGRDPRLRQAATMRGRLWTAWLRRRGTALLQDTLDIAQRAIRDPAARSALLRAAWGLPWVLEQRRPVSLEMERALRMVDSASRSILTDGERQC